MDLNHWNNYYKKNNYFENSEFAEFVNSFITYEESLIDVGCGNGRDSLYFIKNNLEVLGIDFSEIAIDELKKKNNSENFQVVNISNIQNEMKDKNFDICYCRFLLHAIDEDSEDNLLAWTKNNISSLLCIETRITDPKNLNPKQSHFRRFFKEEVILKKLKKLNFEILYSEKSYEFSKYKNNYQVQDLNNDPLLLRIISKVN